MAEFLGPGLAKRISPSNAEIESLGASCAPDLVGDESAAPIFVAFASGQKIQARSTKSDFFNSISGYRPFVRRQKPPPPLPALEHFQSRLELTR